ncbi:MAG: ATP-binding cassette domain-containing protein [Calditrichaeota bacterium]|nr:MAG: ATP-binding cassette domain-containing protein [Calditrichota bacterium]
MSPIPSRLKVAIHSAGRCLARIDDFGFRSGAVTFLLGESGIGKSLLCKILYGLPQPGGLNIDVNDRPYMRYISHARRNSALRGGFFVFQEPSGHFNPMRTVGVQLKEGDLKRVTESERKQVLHSLWPDEEGHGQSLLSVYPKPYRPSGGEKQRLLLAMAFEKLELYLRNDAQRDALFIFDEPSGNLDNAARDIFLERLMAYHQRKPFTAVIVTHDYTVIPFMEEKYAGADIDWLELQRSGALSCERRLAPFPPYRFARWLEGLSPVQCTLDHAGMEAAVLNDVRLRGGALCFYDAQGKETALRLTRGALTYLKAPSGVGKTTVAKILMGLLTPDKGSVTLLNKNIPERGRGRFYREHIWGKVATMVFQHADEALDLELTVEETFRALSKKGTVHKEKLLRRLGEWYGGERVGDLMHQKVKYLSGGQKQRLNLLRAFVLNTDILILDEPLNGLDLEAAALVIRKIQDRQREGKAILIISHNEAIMEAIVSPGHTYHLQSRRD